MPTILPKMGPWAVSWTDATSQVCTIRHEQSTTPLSLKRTVPMKLKQLDVRLASQSAYVELYLISNHQQHQRWEKLSLKSNRGFPFWLALRSPLGLNFSSWPTCSKFKSGMSPVSLSPLSCRKEETRNQKWHWQNEVMSSQAWVQFPYRPEARSGIDRAKSCQGAAK